MALGKHFSTIKFIEPAISSVTSLTFFLIPRGILFMIDITVSEDVPFIIAIKTPFFPFADLFVNTVYNSPLDKEVSSILIFSSIFSGYNIQSSACSFCSHVLKSLK